MDKDKYNSAQIQIWNFIQKHCLVLILLFFIFFSIAYILFYRSNLFIADREEILRELIVEQNKKSSDEKQLDIFKNNDDILTDKEDVECNVKGINLHGELVTYISRDNFDFGGEVDVDQVSSESIILDIEDAQKDDNIKAIIIEIDSPGGYPVAGEEVMKALQWTSKPTIVYIRSVGASAAYWAATGADTIFASVNSEVGSIGVTASFVDFSEKMKKDGVSYTELSTGIFKDTGSGYRPLTNKERTLIERDMWKIKDNFVEAVSKNRKIDRKQIELIADGSTMLGVDALNNGLVDKIGGYLDVLEFVSSTIETKPILCW